MANTFTATSGWRYGGSNNKSILMVEGTLVIDTTGGGTAGDLPVALFGMSKLIGVGEAIISDNSKSYFTTPAYDGKSLMVGGGASNAPMNLPNGTYKLCVQGFSQ